MLAEWKEGGESVFFLPDYVEKTSEGEVLYTTQLILGEYGKVTYEIHKHELRRPKDEDSLERYGEYAGEPSSSHIIETTAEEYYPVPRGREHVADMQMGAGAAEKQPAAQELEPAGHDAYGARRILEAHGHAPHIAVEHPEPTSRGSSEETPAAPIKNSEQKVAPDAWLVKLLSFDSEPGAAKTQHESGREINGRTDPAGMTEQDVPGTTRQERLSEIPATVLSAVLRPEPSEATNPESSRAPAAPPVHHINSEHAKTPAKTIEAHSLTVEQHGAISPSTPRSGAREIEQRGAETTEPQDVSRPVANAEAGDTRPAQGARIDSSENTVSQSAAAGSRMPQEQAARKATGAERLAPKIRAAEEHELKSKMPAAELDAVLRPGSRHAATHERFSAPVRTEREAERVRTIGAVPVQSPPAALRDLNRGAIYPTGERRPDGAHKAPHRAFTNETADTVPTSFQKQEKGRISPPNAETILRALGIPVPSVAGSPTSAYASSDARTGQAARVRRLQREDAPERAVRRAEKNGIIMKMTA